jgi:CheY-like chemotaxis protein
MTGAASGCGEFPHSGNVPEGEARQRDEGPVYSAGMARDPKRVLIVDDDPAQCRGVCQLLSRRKIKGAPIEGECAQSLEEGLAILHVQRFDTVVLDMGFPNSTPEETLLRIPQFQAHCPVLCMTGSDDRVLLGKLRAMRVQWVIKGEDPTESSPQILEKILMALALNDPSPEIADAAIEAQREMAHAIHAEHEHVSAEVKKPWLLQWVPAMGLALSLTVASFTGGSFLMKWLVERATSSAALSSRVEEQNRVIAKLLEKSNHLEMQAQSSAQDRDVIHKKMAELAETQSVAKTDLLRGQDRIEAVQRDILKELLSRKN